MKIWRESVKLWLSELKDLAYDAEDLIEEYEYDVHQAEADEIEEEVETEESEDEGEEGQSTNQVSRSPFSISAIVDFRSKIQMINERYDKIVTERQNLNLEGERVHDTPSLQRATGSLPAEPKIYGREEDKGKILNALLSDAPVTDGVPTVAIVGMGGLGKTTLAQLLYNDKEVRGLFPSRGWVHVSQDYDVIKLAQSIVQCFTDEPCDLTQLSALQTALVHAVEEKKFLLVLDDVWSVDDSLCDGILTALRFGSSGSRVLMTTRDEMAARRMNLITLHRLGHLPDDDCWKLFLRHAIGTSDSVEMQLNMTWRTSDPRSLRNAALGGILRFEDDKRQWMHVLESDLWKEDHDKDTGILGALKLSYIHLPARLKRCFGCCSVFPKGYQMSKEELVYMWMAYGLIEDQNGKSGFSLGIDHINHLIMRSLLLLVTREDKYEDPFKRKCILMHDLVHDLAQNVFGEECVKIKKSPVRINTYSWLYSVAPESMRARVFIPYLTHRALLIEMELAGIFIHLKSLRALVLHDVLTRGLLKSIAELKHLRYLDLRYCHSGEKLPGAVCRLYNLQVLCPGRAKLPRNIKNLVNLQHLEASDNSAFPSPPGIGKLTKLTHLSCFVVGEDKEKHASIEELKHLNNLEGELSIRDLHKVRRSEDAEAARLRDKEHIVTLKLIWEWDSVPINEEQVLEALQPHVNLVNLGIEHYRGRNLPNWLGHPSYGKLAAVKLFGCLMCQNLPSLGQLPRLNSLDIDWLPSVKHIGSEFYYFNAHKCSIPCRNQDIIRNNVESFLLLEEWDSYGANEDESFCQFPSLAVLSVKSCPLLKVIAPAFPSLRELHLVNCPMLESLPTMPLVETVKLGGEFDEDLLSSKVLPKLKKLELSRCFDVKIISMFPALEYLEISELFFLERIEFWAPSNVPGCPSQPSSLPPSSTGSSSNPGASSSMQVGSPHACNQTSPLRIMKFRSCWKLDFPSEEWDSCGANEDESFCLFPSLAVLSVMSCPLLKVIAPAFPSLRELRLDHCPMLKSLPTMPLVDTVKLEGECDEDLLSSKVLPKLKKLELSRWHNVKIISLYSRFPALEYLDIKELSNLERIEFWAPSNVPGCPSQPSSLPPSSTGSSSNPGASSSMQAGSPHACNQTSPLRIMNFGYCEKLDFPSEEQLPPMLEKLYVGDCPKLKEWCIAHRETKLAHVQVEFHYWSST